MAGAAATYRQDPDSVVVAAKKEYDALLGQRSWWDAMYRDLSDYFQPWRTRWLATDANKPKRNSKNARNRALLAVRVLRAGMMSGLMPQATPWFGLTTGDPDLAKFRTVKPYLWDVRNITFEAFAKTNVYDAAHESFGDDGVFGTSSLSLEEDDRDKMRAYVDPVGSFVAQNSARLEVDTWYGRTTMTVLQLAKKFGLKNCSDAVNNLWDAGNYHERIEVVHGIRPNDRRDYGRVLNFPDGRKYATRDNMAYKSCWFEKDGSDRDKYLMESGYNRFPPKINRWEKTGEDAYGRPPAIDCLGAAKGLQKFEDRRLQALDKLLTPPMNAPIALRDQGGVTQLPGETNYYDSAGPNMKVEPAYLVDPRMFTEARDELHDIEDQIDEALFYDLFLLIAKDERSGVTAEEIRAKKEERLLQVGPTIQRTQREKLAPLVEDAIEILDARGDLPPRPRELLGVKLTIEFLAPLAAAQRAVQTESLERTMAFATNVSKFIPNVLDNVDADEAFLEYAKSINAPPKIVRDADAVKRIRADREAADQAQKAAEMAKPAKDAMTAAKMAAETVPQPGNVGERLAQALPVPPPSAPASAVLPPGLSAVPGNAA
jgi:hypothetical protein